MCRVIGISALTMTDAYQNRSTKEIGKDLEGNAVCRDLKWIAGVIQCR